MHSGAAENGALVVVAEARRLQDQVDGIRDPGKWIIRTEIHMVRTDNGNEVGQRFGREDDRVVIHVGEIFARLPFQLHLLSVGKC